MISAWMSSMLGASELSKAYQKEYTFLKAQKSELESRLLKDEQQQNLNMEEAQKKLSELQKKFLSLTEEMKGLESKVTTLGKKANEVADNSDLTSNVLLQAGSALKEYGIPVDESNQTTATQKLNRFFSDSRLLYTKLSSVYNEKGKFYLPDGKPVEGEIVKIGNIAAYGISKEAAGALAPAGDGQYKLWSAVDSSDDAKALYAGENLDQINLFVYENLDKEVEFKKEKTVGDTIRAGGVIGYIILGLGLFGILLLILRAYLLLRSGSKVENMTGIVVKNLETGTIADAQEAIKGYGGSTARVIKATLRNISKSREHIEDVVMENILNESSRIDRYGNFVLVIAAVAPLLGLLGTVTGMISTFDIITEYGTGDPKLLSGGISEALVTTMLGLIVAIPLLLLGNLLSGWAQNIKDSMEQSSLHIINVYEKSSAER